MDTYGYFCETCHNAHTQIIQMRHQPDITEIENTTKFHYRNTVLLSHER